MSLRIQSATMLMENTVRIRVTAGQTQGQTLIARSRRDSAIMFPHEEVGIGMPIPTSSWGNMIAESRRDLAINVWPCVWPAVTLILTVFSINIVADWIRKDMAARTSALS